MTARAFPKVIWILWLQGWEKAPRIVKACWRSWEIHNPDWTIRCLDRTNAGSYIDNPEARLSLDDHGQPPEACSDRLRIALLDQHGGVWVDATTYCLQPLDDWLQEVSKAGFFAFDRPGPDRIVASWFLAGISENYLINRWSQRTLEYWREREERHHYYWFHYLFGAEYESDPQFRLAYDKVPKISADGPHFYQVPVDRLCAAVTEEDRIVVGHPKLPLLKLSHHHVDRDYPTGSVIEYLCIRLNR